MKKAGIILCAVLAAAILLTGTIYLTAAFGAISPERVIGTLTPENYGMKHENFSITFEGTSLSGWLIPASDGLSDKTVVFSHNRKSNREIPEADGFVLMRDLSDNGYNVVTFDYLGSGASEGDFYTFGVSEAGQLSAVIDYALEEIPGTSLSVIGFGCGAAAAIETAKRPEVKGVVAESCYDSFNVGIFSAYTALPLPSIGMAIVESFSGTKLSLSPAETLSEITGKHFYFIHCLEDPTVDYTGSQKLNLLASGNNESDLWLIEEGGHCLGALADEANYSAHIILFLDSFM